VRLTRLVEGIALLVLVAVLLGQILGQPVLFGYVTSGSMEPALSAGDGFVAVPASVAGDVDEGDVVVFDAQELGGGGLTTHRVVEETDRGYVTRGDANPFTDQDSGEPPVKSPQIVAVALTVDGHVVAIPHLGSVVAGVEAAGSSVLRALSVTGLESGIRLLSYLLVGAGIASYVVGIGRASGRVRSARSGRSRERGPDERWNDRQVAALLFGGLLVVVTASMVVPSGPVEFGIVSSEVEAPGARVIETGTTDTTSYRVVNGGVVPIVSHVAPVSDGIAVDSEWSSVPGRSATNVSVTLSAPPETGYYRKYLVEYQYLAVLPRPTIQALHGVHPWLPVVVIDLLVGVVWALPTAWLLRADDTRERRRSRSRGGEHRE